MTIHTLSKRRRFFDYVLTEAIGSLKEEAPSGQPPQQQLPAIPPPPAPNAPPPAMPTGPTPSPEAPPTDQQQTPLTIDTIIDRLNVIRGGKSFSEPDVYKALTDMFATVSDQDKEAANRFLVSVGKVVTNTEEVQPGGDAPQPAGSAQTQNVNVPQAPMGQKPGGGQQPVAGVQAQPGIQESISLEGKQIVVEELSTRWMKRR